MSAETNINSYTVSCNAETDCGGGTANKAGRRLLFFHRSEMRPKKEREKTFTVATSLTKEWLDKLDTLSHAEGRSRANVLKLIIETYLRERESEPK